ncbi:ATP-grasp domain-containing protein [Roseiconus nitratireducens]|uniref:ATP-grasp domain-containing protein n=1 Tax=Roseiconus nitratireducens TaxID=2605748 RepID=UPI0013760ECE|nr:ATP-grasp domain-containing protein [Roseiconus nitratireducens]
MNRHRFLMIGPSAGWHAEELRAAARRMNCRLQIVPYEALAASVATGKLRLNASGSGLPGCEDGIRLQDHDAILTRTMPMASLDRLTFRLAILHALSDRIGDQPIPVVNPPRALELAIDKFATLARLAAAGYPIPETRFVQSRSAAMAAFDDLGGDCVVKPVLGGEGRGVMRIRDPQLAWTCFSTLDKLESVLQVQRFIPPGGRDTRLLVIGHRVFAVRRENDEGFRSNVSAGAVCRAASVSETMAESGRRIAAMLGLVYASVDLIDNDNGPPLFLEVNAIPGWKGAQSVIEPSLAECIVETLQRQTSLIQA